jgi:glycosyltransferase involved in cell wall biosynthesis
MKILQLITVRRYRGAEVFAAQLSEELAKRCHHLTLAALYPPPPVALGAKGVHLIDLNGTPAKPLNRKLMHQLARLIHDVQPDILQANGADTLKYAVLARRLLSGKTPIIYRNISMASQWIKSPLHRWFYTWLFDKVQHVVSISQEAMCDIQHTYRIPAHRLSVIPQGIFIPEKVDKAAAQAYLFKISGKEMKTPIMLHVGAFSPEKNHAALLRLMEKLTAAQISASLVLVGEGSLKQQVQQTILEKGLAQNVYLLGVRPDLPNFMAAADMLVLPSLIEGVPGVVLEAQANAVPIVAYDVGSVFEGVADHRGKVPLHSEDALFETVKSLLGQPAVLQEMGKAGRELMIRERSLEVSVMKYELLYKSILAGKL